MASWKGPYNLQTESQIRISCGLIIVINAGLKAALHTLFISLQAFFKTLHFKSGSYENLHWTFSTQMFRMTNFFIYFKFPAIALAIRVVTPCCEWPTSMSHITELQANKATDRHTKAKTFYRAQNSLHCSTSIKQG